MKNISTFLSVFFTVLLLGAPSFAQIDWPGEYHFNEDGGTTAGGTKIFIAHTLKIKRKKGGQLSAHLYSQGFQTSNDLFAVVKIKADKLLLYFRQKGADHTLGDYREGDLLLTLVRSKIDGKPALLTYWHKFQPALEANKRSGRNYFRKVGKLNMEMSLPPARPATKPVEKTALGNGPLIPDFDFSVAATITSVRI